MDEPVEATLTQVLLPSVKPDPPESVRLRTAGHRLQVLWHPPASWPFPDVFSLKYRLRYRRHGASHFRQVRCAGGGVVWKQEELRRAQSWMLVETGSHWVITCLRLSPLCESAEVTGGIQQ